MDIPDTVEYRNYCDILPITHFEPFKIYIQLSISILYQYYHYNVLKELHSYSYLNNL